SFLLRIRGLLLSSAGSSVVFRAVAICTALTSGTTITILAHFHEEVLGGVFIFKNLYRAITILSFFRTAKKASKHFIILRL
ncbi:15650_t:CDS:2, partial [Gigaspora rosea]